MTSALLACVLAFFVLLTNHLTKADNDNGSICFYVINPIELIAVRKRKSYYELSRSQVDTPPPIVKVFWGVVSKYRKRLKTVLDLGAGDGRFAMEGPYKTYVGVEIDKSRKAMKLPKNASIAHECAFRHKGSGYSACIGNPPYVRHHDLEPEWRDEIAQQFSSHCNVELNRKCNLYVYFLFLSLLKTTANGLVAVIVPYDWLSRPSARPLREFIERNQWDVDAYRFSHSIFSQVETTAAIVIIDKRSRNGEWNFFSINANGETIAKRQVTGSSRKLLTYSERGEVWAMRGMSPGTQKVFTLTEGERIHAGLKKSDVYPCITSMKNLPKNISILTRSVFQARFVEDGFKCWLIKSNCARISDRLQAYLEAVPKELRENYTCMTREIWHKFVLSPKPDILASSGFVGTSPKVVINSVGAFAVGAIHGVYGVPDGSRRDLQNYLSTLDFSSQIVAHSGKLMKIEVKQLNSALNKFMLQETAK